MGGIRNSGTWQDNPAGLDMDVPVFGAPNLGTSGSPLGTVYAGNIVADNISGDPLLANNNYLDSNNAAGTGTVGLIKAGTSNQTIINTPSGTTAELRVNDTLVHSYSSTQFLSPKYVLSDGSDKNYNLAAYGTGTAYALTGTAAALTFGTTQPALTINKAGTYLITATANLQYNGATFAANRTVTIKLRRTNNTAADLTNGSAIIGTNVTTTVTGTLEYVTIQVVYTTSATDDAVTIFGDVSTIPSAGSLDVTQASIVATRLYNA